MKSNPLRLIIYLFKYIHLEENMNYETLNKICGLVYGQALGDAFGLTTEFENKSNIP